MVPVAVLGPAGERAAMEATIDTGFNGYVTLPSSVVSDLGLPFVGSTLATLADGRTASLELFLAALEWLGGSREVLALQAEGAMLLGMAALEGTRVSLDAVDGGAVTIQAL